MSWNNNTCLNHKCSCSFQSYIKCVIYVKSCLNDPTDGCTCGVASTHYNAPLRSSLLEILSAKFVIEPVWISRADSVTTCTRPFSSYFTHIQYKQSQAKKEDSCVPEHGICWSLVRTRAPPNPKGPKHEVLGQGILFVFIGSWRAFCNGLHNMSSSDCCFQFKAVTKTS